MAVACDTCGASAPDGSAFCSSCGSPLTRPSAVPPVAASPAWPAPAPPDAAPAATTPTLPEAAPPASAPPEPPLSGAPQPPVAPPPVAAGPPSGPSAPPSAAGPSAGGYPPHSGAGHPGGYPPPPGAGAAPPPYVLSAGYGAPAPAPAAPGGYGPRPIEHILAYGYRLDIGAVLSEGWRLFTMDIGGFIGFAFVGGVIAVLLAITLVGFLFYMPLLAGLWIVPLMMLKSRPHGFNDFFGGFKQLGQLVLLGLVMGFLIMLGAIAFIIPGVYLGIAWIWALGLVLDRGMGFWEAMSTSLKVVNKNFWETLLLVLVIGVINGVGSMVVVGSLVTFPLSFCILVAGYKAVFGVDPRT